MADNQVNDQDDFDKKYMELESIINGSKTIITDHNKSLRNEIELNFEKITKKSVKERDALIKRIDDFENEFLSRIDIKIHAARKFLGESKIDRNKNLLEEKTDQFKLDILKNQKLGYKHQEQLIGRIEENCNPSIKDFDFSTMFKEPNYPVYEYKLDRSYIDEINYEYHLISFGIDSFVICVKLKSQFQISLMKKRGDLVQLQNFQNPSIFSSFCANTTRLFMLVNQDSIRLIYEFDENLRLRRVKEVNDSSIRVSCDDIYIFLLVQKSIDSYCSFCFEIYTDSIQEIERGSFKFMISRLHGPSINEKYNLSSRTQLEICSNEKDTFVFYNDSNI